MRTIFEEESVIFTTFCRGKDRKTDQANCLVSSVSNFIIDQYKVFGPQATLLLSSLPHQGIQYPLQGNTALPPSVCRMPSHPASSPLPPPVTRQASRQAEWHRLIKPYTTHSKIISNPWTGQITPADHQAYIARSSDRCRDLVPHAVLLHPACHSPLCD